MSKELIKAIAFDNTIRIAAVDATEVVREAQRAHDTWQASTAALGRTLAAGLLFGSDIKDDARLAIKIAGDGPAGKIVVMADGSGEVKGYVDQPHISLPENDQNKIDVKGAVGTNGMVTVTKDLGLKEPFSGQSPIVSGEIAEDLTYYLTVSEQTPSAIGLGVLVNPDESVENAGGWMIQVIPDASEETIEQVETAVANVPAITTMLSEGKTATDIIFELLGEENVKILDERSVAFKCDCSKAHFARGLATLPVEDLDTIIEEDGEAEAVCHFCNQAYHYSKEELEAIREEANHK